MTPSSIFTPISSFAQEFPYDPDNFDWFASQLGVPTENLGALESGVAGSPVDYDAALNNYGGDTLNKNIDPSMVTCA